jgi:hypothetical protein
MPPREPSLGRLLGKGVVSLVGDVLKFLVDEAFAGRKPTKAFEQFLSFLIVLAAMASSAVGLLLGCLYFFIAYADDFAAAAAAATMEDYDEEAKGRMCVTRTASAEAPPKPEELRRAWEAARGRGPLVAKLLVGTLLSNLEPAVDQSYLRAEDGTIVGRRPGLKGWLRGYCPDLVPHYKALMSYKALADKLRIALGIEEPDTLSGVIDFGGVVQNGGEEPSGVASPCGDAARGGSTKKDGESVLDGRATKDAGGATWEGREKPKSLKFRKSFRLQTTNGKTVIEGIHALFGNQGVPTSEPEMTMGNTLEAVKRKTASQSKERMAGDTAKTSVFSSETDTTVLRAEAVSGDVPGPWNMVGPWNEPEPMTMSALEKPGPMTMAALEEAVRERLGLCWMRRAGRRPKPA